MERPEKVKGVRKIILCDSCASCPEIEAREDGSFVIRDDFSGQAQLTKKEFKMLLKKGGELLR